MRSYAGNGFLDLRLQNSRYIVAAVRRIKLADLNRVHVIVDVDFYHYGLQILGTGCKPHSFKLGLDRDSDDVLHEYIIKMKPRLESLAILAEFENDASLGFVDRRTARKERECRHDED